MNLALPLHLPITRKGDWLAAKNADALLWARLFPRPGGGYNESLKCALCQMNAKRLSFTKAASSSEIANLAVQLTQQ